MNKIGYHYHNLMTYGRSYSTEEEEALFAHFGISKPGASLFLDNEGRALRAKATVPECAVVVRSYRPENDEGRLQETLSPQQLFDLYKNTPKGLIRYIYNEPNAYIGADFRKAVAHFTAEVMDLFGSAGIPIVAPNWGEGHPDVDHLDDLEELWKAFDKWHELHFYGTHEYGSHLGMLYNTSSQHDMFPWRIGRFDTFIVPYLQKHEHKIPNVIVTEYGCDSAHDGTSYRGWKTCWTEAQYFSEIKTTIDRIYSAPYYKGLCVFSYGNTGKQNTQEDWVTFDVSGAQTFKTLVESYAKTQRPTSEQPIVTPPPVVIPPAPVPAPVIPPPDAARAALYAEIDALTTELTVLTGKLATAIGKLKTAA